MDNVVNRAPYEDGNRLAVQGVGGAHFFYHLDRPVFTWLDGDRIVRSVKAYVDGYPLTSAQVVVLDSSEFESVDPPVFRGLIQPSVILVDVIKCGPDHHRNHS